MGWIHCQRQVINNAVFVEFFHFDNWDYYRWTSKTIFSHVQRQTSGLSSSCVYSSLLGEEVSLLIKMERLWSIPCFISGHYFWRIDVCPIHSTQFLLLYRDHTPARMLWLWHCAVNLHTVGSNPANTSMWGIFSFARCSISICPGLTSTPPWSNGYVLDHRTLPPVFESRRAHIWRVFHLWLRFITFAQKWP